MAFFFNFENRIRVHGRRGLAMTWSAKYLVRGRCARAASGPQKKKNARGLQRKRLFFSVARVHFF